MSNPTALTLVKALDACTSGASASAHGSVARPLHPSELPVLDTTDRDDTAWSAAEQEILAGLTSLRQSRVRDREEMLDRIRAHHYVTGRGFAFIGLCSDGLLAPITGENATNVSASTRMMLHRIREDRLDDLSKAAAAMISIDQDWADDLLDELAPALSDREFDAWIRPDQQTIVGWVSADGSILAWSEGKMVLRPSKVMSRATGTNAI